MMRNRILLFIALLTFGSIGYAQRTEPQETKSQFGKRAAKIPQSDADTGLHYNEGAMKRAAAKHFYELRTSGEIKDIALIEKLGYEEFKKVRGAVALKQQSIPVWEQVGGDQDGHNSGRSRSMAFKGENTVYVAYAQGGIWKTDNINDQQPTWVCLTDKLESIAFGAIIADPRNGDIVYAGTGEAEGDNFQEPPGAGLFKTVDGGLNWTKILGTDTLGTRCSEMAINPKNPDIIYIATGTTRPSTGSSPLGGVIKSTDAGATWQISNLRGFTPLDIEIDPEDTARLYASGTGKIYRTTNSGESWQQLTSGLPTATVGRIELAIAPSEPNRIYASIGKSTDRSTLGLWQSTDRGDTWFNQTTSPANWHGQQQEYATGIVVHPTISRQVFVGGLDIYKTNDNGKTFSQASVWSAPIAQNNYSHADVHGMYFNNGTLYVNNDGGISMSKNSGTSFNTKVNKGIATLQFVHVDADKDFNFVLGGTQDNGTNYALTTDKSFVESRGGDGGYVNISQDDPKVWYSEYVEGEMFKSQTGQPDGPWQPMDPPFKGAARFYMPYDFDASGTFGIAGAGSLYVTQTGGAGAGAWTKITSPNISSAAAVHIYPGDPTYMWASSGSSFYRSTDAGTTFAKGTSPTGASSISGIVADPANPLNVWICSQGMGASNKHVYKSTDGGVTFTALPNFPNVGCNWIARRPSTGGLFVATDKGVLYTVNEGQSWFALEEGMPNVQVLTLEVRGNDNQWLLAGTYGRGMFKLNINDLKSTEEPALTQPTSVVTLSAVSPNPIISNTGTVNFSLSKSTVVTATLYDVLGRTVKILAKSPFTGGKHSLNFTTNELPAGSYIISVAAEGIAKTQRVIIE